VEFVTWIRCGEQLWDQGGEGGPFSSPRPRAKTGFSRVWGVGLPQGRDFCKKRRVGAVWGWVTNEEWGGHGWRMNWRRTG